MGPYRLIDLFCGAGGMSLGFAQCNFQSVWANDINEDAARTYNHNFGNHCTTRDIVELLDDKSFEVPKADIVIGGPPCQGFSLLNKNREIDPRKALWLPFLEIVRRSGAGLFVMENVPELLSSEEIDLIEENAAALGFQISKTILNAADYGASQRRKRAIIIGTKQGDPAAHFPPRATHCDPKLLDGRLPLEGIARLPWRTVRDAIGDLPKPVGTEIRRDAAYPMDLHFGRNPTPMSVERYKAIPKEGMNRFDLLRNAPHLTPGCWVRKKTGGTDLFGRLWWDRPAFTIRTEFYKPEKGRYLHPSQHRPITHREAARLQGFPDSFEFLGTKIEVARQIGNAVPPPLAAAIAKCAQTLLGRRHAYRGRHLRPRSAKPHNVENPKRKYGTRTRNTKPTA